MFLEPREEYLFYNKLQEKQEIDDIVVHQITFNDCIISIFIMIFIYFIIFPPEINYEEISKNIYEAIKDRNFDYDMLF